MTAFINASTSSGVVITPDNSGNILLQYNGVAAPAFSTYIGSTQTIPHATNTKLQFNTEVFDTNSNYDTTNYRFTPTVAGYYQIDAKYLIQATSGRTYEFVCKLYKNGSSYTESYNSFVMSTGTTKSMGVNAVIYMNGSTDYLEVYTNNYDYTASTTTTALGGSTYANFSGCLLRGA